ncbi:MAG: CrcB family protein [Chloroflexi bacterium]|nr:CrcB family protein [Chloroflexota bacterium]
MVWLMVALGGAVGSVLRYGVGRLAATYLGSPTLLDTFIVNISGSFALGVFLTMALERVAVPVEVRGLVAVGLLGGYTTFSTLTFEAIRVAESGELLKAGVSIAGNVVIGLLAAYLGVLAARSF